MKIMFIIMLAISVIQAQSLQTDTLKIILSSDSDEAISLVMQLYRGYEQDCYKDSFQVWQYPPEKITNGVVCDSMRYKVMKWQHKEPSFIEFMNYLKRWW